MKNPRLLLVNIYTHQNTGESARHFGICQGLRADLPQAQLAFVAPDALTEASLRSTLGPDAQVLKQAIPSSSSFFCFYPLRLPALLQAYRCADMVISIGGHFGQLSSLSPLLLGILMRKRLAICSASTYDGQRQGRLHRWLARRILDKAELITLREETSLVHLRQWGITRPQMQVTADPAFLLAANQAEADRLLADAGLKECRPLVGVNVSRCPAVSRADHARHMTAMVHLINYLTGELKLNVLLLPFCFVKGNDDREDSRQVLALARQPERVIRIDQSDPAVVRGLLRHLEMFIGMRYHANILSLAEGVPALAISYHHKMEGAMAALGMQTWLCPSTALDATLLINKSSQLWHMRDDVRRQLSSLVPEMERRARLGTSLIKDALVATGNASEVTLEERLYSDAR